jgi:hypothetical protein
MRHVCLPSPVAGLAQGRCRAAPSALLVLLVGTTELFPPRGAGAFGRAVPPFSIAPAADGEQLPQ